MMNWKYLEGSDFGLVAAFHRYLPEKNKGYKT
jgi:hypothetical protein